MSLLIALLIGLAVGGLGGFVVREEYDTLLMNLLCGIVGSILGLGMYVLFLGGLNNAGYLSGRGVVCSLIGAVFAVGLFDIAQKLSSSTADNK